MDRDGQDKEEMMNDELKRVLSFHSSFLLYPVHPCLNLTWIFRQPDFFKDSLGGEKEDEDYV
jgi:hypothetical protein